MPETPEDVREAQHEENEITFVIDTASTSIGEGLDTRDPLTEAETISSETDYIVAGPRPSETLMTLAHKFDITVIGEREFRTIIQEFGLRE